MNDKSNSHKQRKQKDGEKTFDIPDLPALTLPSYRARESNPEKQRQK